MLDARIPARTRSVVSFLVGLDHESFQSLEKLVEDDWSRLALGEFESHLQELPKSVEPDLLLNLLIGTAFQGKENELSPEETAEAFATAALKQKFLGEEDTGVFRARLAELLALPSVLKMSVAMRLVGDYERLFHEASIATDIRPIVVDEAIEGAILAFTLRVTYHENGEPKTFVATLDASDLDGLDQAIQEARRNADSVRALLKSTGTKILSQESEK